MSINSLKIVLCIFLSLGIFNDIQAQIDTLQILKDMNVPLVYIETIESEEPTCDKVSDGEVWSAANQTKVPGRLVVYKKGEILYDSGEYLADSTGMKIKIRGNSSAFYQKTPYKIKLEKKADLLCRGDKKFKDKEWALLYHGYLLIDQVGYHVSKLAGLQWAPENMNVNLYMNGTYRGMYTLIETTKRNADCRLNVAKDGGYIFEHDRYYWNEPNYVLSTLHPKTHYTFKYPDDEDITQEQLDYMQGVVSEMEDSIKNGNPSCLIDEDSFARWLLVHDLLGTNDAFGSNIFFTKYDSTADSKVMMGNVWDLDTAFSLAENWSGIHTNLYHCFYYLLKNKQFANEYAELWESLKSEGLAEKIQSYLDSILVAEDVSDINLSRTFEHAQRPKIGVPTVEDEISTMKNWFANREQWIDENITVYSGIEDVVDEQNNNKERIYNISGYQTANPQKGVYIKIDNKGKIKKYIMQ